MTKKQQQELHIFDEFRRLSPKLILTRVEQPEPPAPDILADFCGVRVGIEITRYIQDPAKRRESDEERITEMARDQYRATGKPPVGVSVHWGTHIAFHKSDRGSVSKALSSMVAQNVPPLGTWLEVAQASLPEPLASTVDYLRIDRLIDYAESDWRIPRAGWFPTILPAHIREIINTKESRIDGYRRHCTAAWLLIASEGFAPSSWCELSKETRCERYTTRFGRVFFLGTLPSEVIELGVRQT